MVWSAHVHTRPQFAITLDVLLTEGSVARAARRLRLSPSAMSRALARLRETTGDPLLVRAGRGLVPTPRAVELRERVSQVVEEGQAVLRPAGKLNLKQLVQTFTLQTSEGFVENFGPDLIALVGEEAPGVRLHFLQKANKDSAHLRDGTVDLETGVIEKTTAQELRVQALFRDRLIGVVRTGHPLSNRPRKNSICAIQCDQFTWRVGIRIARRMRTKAVQQGRSERSGESYSCRTVSR